VRRNATDSLDLDGLSDGRYDLILGGDRSRTTRNRLWVGPKGPELAPWSGPTALLMPPGLADLLHRDVHGAVYLTAGLGSAALWWKLDRDADDAKAALADARERQLTATGADWTRARLDESRARADFADDDRMRKIWLAYTGGLWLGSAAETWLLTPSATLSPGEEGEWVVHAAPRSRGAALWRSLLIPGAGQRFVGRDTRANFFLGSCLAATAASLIAQDAFLTARRDVGDARRHLEAAQTTAERDLWSTRLSKSQQDRDDLSLVRWVLVGGSTYLYLWNLVDAYRGGAPRQRQDLTVSLSPTRGGVQLAVRWGAR
jgi:hypothetical protein